MGGRGLGVGALTGEGAGIFISLKKFLLGQVSEAAISEIEVRGEACSISRQRRKPQSSFLRASPFPGPQGGGWVRGLAPAVGL